MDQKREELFRSAGNAHGDIQAQVFELEHLARAVEYLHPKLADDIWDIAGKIEQARKTIQGNSSQLLNMDFADSQRQMGEIFTTLLDKAAN